MLTQPKTEGFGVENQKFGMCWGFLNDCLLKHSRNC